ncbi:MAG: phospholipase [Rhodothermales bacterium]|nr:phospholipase [Rhodothermales bacterium]
MSEESPDRTVIGPHAGQPVLRAGRLVDADRALILVHGRYATAQSMLPLVDVLKLDGWLTVAPQADGGTWYPESFLAPIEQNEPYLSSALDLLDAVVESIIEESIDPAAIALLGFSQGACLALEYAARSSRRLGGVVGLSGGLIGPPGTQFDYAGGRDSLRVFLGCSDVDPHIPVERVRETERVFRSLGADVTAEIYTGMGHTIVAAELEQTGRLLASIGSARTQGKDPL